MTKLSKLETMKFDLSGEQLSDAQLSTIQASIEEEILLELASQEVDVVSGGASTVATKLKRVPGKFGPIINWPGTVMGYAPYPRNLPKPTSKS